METRIINGGTEGGASTVMIDLKRYKELLKVEKRFKDLAFYQDFDDMLEQNGTEMPNGKLRSKKHIEYLKDNWDMADLDWSEMNDQIAHRLEKLDDQFFENDGKKIDGESGESEEHKHKDDNNS
jgi:hypothetical protein